MEDQTLTDMLDAARVEDDISDPPTSAYFPCNFPLSQEAFDRYYLVNALGQRSEGLDFAKAGLLALQVNRARLPEQSDTEALRPGQVMAFALLTEVLRHVLDLYTRQQLPGVFAAAADFVANRRGSGRIPKAASTFVQLYPPQTVRQGEQEPADFLNSRTKEVPNDHRVLREMVLVALSMENPAAKPIRPLFDDTVLQREVDYRELTGMMEDFFHTQPPVDPVNLKLFDCLRAPIQASPDSLEGQLEYIRTRWAKLLPAGLLRQLLKARDLLREETQIRGFGPGKPEVLRFGPGAGGAMDYGYPEPERFTADIDWMANTVLIAKVVYVWLDQLSKRYGRGIHRLDEIPDEEFDRLAHWGFNALWLIGVWERSPASREIKQRMGNPDAAASAYSLYDYVIAADLGGDEALENLRQRAWQRGIRLASDMVPNHVGLYSRWVIEHPHWFVQVEHPPFPGYQFSGPDLSHDDRVSIQIEDGYWTKSDAAVVFKRVDKWTGDTRYIYHGNDGTHMPWNDTAQLNYLHPEVREAVIQTILHVARQFRVIRFDAAMTLAKKHFQRLWFPQPGEGGAIPSRSMFGMSRQEFDAAMPNEFWREVVDRIQAEMPDTLLIAEAFWLMEGYFVRTLGMHRVYNSAFMNMLKMEENLNYRTTVKNVLEFSPEVIKRFVNFMNNPDEMTAVAQFGKGDKYFGVAMMMVTMPGLPMFGHGQIEGFTEKYGMEYRRAYWDEPVDEELVRRHEREIFPLIRRRYLFSQATHFAFYDFIHPDGYVVENVFAYSNRAGDERALVLYNNAYESTVGHIHTSTALNHGTGENKDLRHVTLGEALGLRADPGIFYIFRDHRTNLQYIREGRDVVHNGLHVQLNGYQYQVFLDFQEVFDTEGLWRQVHNRLGGKGTRDIHRLYREMRVQPLLEPFSKVVSMEMLTELAAACKPRTKGVKVRKALCSHLGRFMDVAESDYSLGFDREAVLESVDAVLESVQCLESRLKSLRRNGKLFEQITSLVPEDPQDGVLFWRIPLLWSVLAPLEEALSIHSVEGGAGWVEEWLLSAPITDTFMQLGRDDWQAREDMALLMIVLRHTPALLTVHESEASHLFADLLDDPIVRDYLYIHEYQGVEYMNREQLHEALGMLMLAAAASTIADSGLDADQQQAIIASRLECVQTVLHAADTSSYQVRHTLDTLLQAEDRTVRSPTRR